METINPVEVKLQRIVLDRLEFRQATLCDAVEYLGMESQRLDLDEPDPARRGVALRVKEAVATVQAASPGESATPRRVSLIISNTSLGDALFHLALACGTQLFVEDGGAYVDVALPGFLEEESSKLGGAELPVVESLNTSDRRILAHEGYLELGMPAEAKGELEEIEPWLQRLSFVLAYKAEVARRLGRWDVLEACVREYCQRNPTDCVWLIQLGHAVRAGRGPQAAMQVLLEAEVSRFPDNPSTRRAASRRASWMSRSRSRALSPPSLMRSQPSLT